MSENQTHTDPDPHRNCCIIHGCELNHTKHCPIALGKVKQKFLCDDCYNLRYITDRYTEKGQWKFIDKKIEKVRMERRKEKLKRILK